MANQKYVPAYEKGLIPITGEELLMREFPPRENILSPWLPEKGLAMIYAARGIGKTWIGIGIAYAVSVGEPFLGWQPPRSRRIIYIDGEMPAVVFQERFKAISKAFNGSPTLDAFELLSANLHQDGLPDLANSEAQRFYDKAIEGCDLIVIDNLSTIAPGLKENDADAWSPIQQWALHQRAKGRSVLFIHHANKGGGQRGSSRKEDILDTVINLRRPPGYLASHGATFELHFEKNRGFFGEDAAPFQVKLEDGKWYKSELNIDNDDSMIFQLHASGMSTRQIADRQGRSKSTVDRRIQNFKKSCNPDLLG